MNKQRFKQSTLASPKNNKQSSINTKPMV